MRRLLEHLVAGLLAALFGAAIGAAVAWIATFGGHPLNRGGGLEGAADFGRCARAGAIAFGAAGLLLGSRAADLLGLAFGLLLDARPGSAGGDDVPRWAAVLVVVGVAGGAWFLGHAR